METCSITVFIYGIRFGDGNKIEIAQFIFKYDRNKLCRNNVIANKAGKNSTIIYL